MVKQCKCGMVIPKRFLKKGIKYTSCAETGQKQCLTDNVTRDEKCMERCKPSCEYWELTPMVTYGTWPPYSAKTFFKTVHGSDVVSTNHVEISYAVLEVITNKLYFIIA